jgi:hypothetical protein
VAAHSTTINNISIQLLEFEDLLTLSNYIQEWRRFFLGNLFLQGVEVQRWDSDK